MPDKRQFLKHTLIFGVGGILVQMTPFILLPLYTHYLKPSEYGTLGLIYTAADIINTVFLVGGIRLAAMTFYKQADNDEARRRIAVTLSSLLWIAVAVAIAVSVYFIDVIDLFFETKEKKILAFGLAAVMLDALVSVPMTLMQARLESLRFVLTNLTMSLLRLGLNIYFVAGLGWGVWGVLVAHALVMGFSALYLTYRELRIGSIYPDLTKWKEILYFALPLVPNGILAFIYGASGRLFLIHLGPYPHTEALGAVGLYDLALRFVSISVYMGTLPMQQVWRAEMYDVYKKPDASSAFGNFMLRLLCVKIFAVLAISMFAAELVRIMCDPSYYAAAAIVPIFGISSAIAIACAQMNNTFFITRNTNHNVLCTALSLPFLIHLMLLLVPRWGLAGSAIAWTSAQVIYACVVYFFTQRLFDVRYPFRKITLLLAVSFLCYGLSVLCGSGIEWTSLPAEQFETLSRWEKIQNAWDRIQWISLIAKAGILFLWVILIWHSTVLLPDDKALALRIFKKRFQKLYSAKK